MPKQIKKHTPLVTISIIASIILVLILGGTYLYASELNHNTVSNLLEWIVLDKSVKDLPVKDMITYTLPSNWTEIIDTGTGTNLLKSADYKEPTTLNDKDGSGVKMELNISPKYRFESLKSQKHDWSTDSFADTSKITDISIDSVPGLKYEFNHDDIYLLEYFFVKDKYTIKIFVENSNRTTIDEKYWNDINSIINSIKFK